PLGRLLALLGRVLLRVRDGLEGDQLGKVRADLPHLPFDGLAQLLAHVLIVPSVSRCWIVSWYLVSLSGQYVSRISDSPSSTFGRTMMGRTPTTAAPFVS